ncbi:hypothetical protein Q73_02805 [Bacillus coahuilensis m2-6]|uniref:Uncharacterized protein n=1 Tax=Bacillus coahuilensis p1.1.43 TaxID=1150625 RepID=A0A147KB47_9BACI|nr:hypothetical protein Q75_03370 [Bacillus coahuilensis p1.1.43]KUP09560.1 hypothetical protein Q73_02805 [Bacillus coahuilensis m2-6]
MFIGLLATGLILGIMVRFGMKAFTSGYGFANDLENNPVLLKVCNNCNHRIPRNYTKNLCPHCHKPLQ